MNFFWMLVDIRNFFQRHVILVVLPIILLAGAVGYYIPTRNAIAAILIGMLFILIVIQALIKFLADGVQK